MARQRHFIKEWRKHKGLTQEDLAAKVGFDRAYISKIESGKRRYDQVFLEAAAEALECGPADLIRRDPRGPADVEAIWAQIPDEMREQAAAVLSTFRKPDKR